jgi:hypothetical protein
MKIAASISSETIIDDFKSCSMHNASF